MGGKLAVLGSGEAGARGRAARAARIRGRVGAVIGYDEALPT
jgi:hypothetical protein